MSRRRDVLAAMAVAGATSGIAFGRPVLARSGGGGGGGTLSDAGEAFTETDLSGGLPAGREQVLAEKPTQPQFRDATNVWIEDARGALGMRIGVEAVTEAWEKQTVWLDIAFPDGRLISFRSEEAPIHPALDDAGAPTVRGAGPARFQCIEPFRRWRASFNGEAEEMTAGEVIADPGLHSSRKVRVECEVDLDIAVPPWVPGALLPDAARALGGEQGEMVSPRYEQLCRANGKLRIDGKVHDFGGQALRIRRSGYRKFAGFWGHCWQSALFPSGKGFGFNAFPPREDGKPSYAEGYVYDGAGTLIPARPVQIPWLKELRTGGEPVPLVLETLDGRRFEIDGTTYVNIRSRSHGDVPPGFPIVQQSHALYRWDGEEATGMIERSTLAEKMKL